MAMCAGSAHAGLSLESREDLLVAGVGAVRVEESRLTRQRQRRSLGERDGVRWWELASLGGSGEIPQ